MYMGNRVSFTSRRLWLEDGVYYFCTLCGDYKNEGEFYKSKNTPFGITYKCKEHYKKTNEPHDPSMDYLKLSPITETDMEQTKQLLKVLGYKVEPGSLPIWVQFNNKHNLNNKK
jgi:hypothetical protein